MKNPINPIREKCADIVHDLLAKYLVGPAFGHDPADYDKHKPHASKATTAGQDAASAGMESRR